MAVNKDTIFGTDLVFVGGLNEVPPPPITTTQIGGAVIGDPILVVAGTTGFPTSGTIIIDSGLVNQETINYSSIVNHDGVHFVLVGTLSQNHSDGAVVTLV
jgi:hypothetical protein